MIVARFSCLFRMACLLALAASASWCQELPRLPAVAVMPFTSRILDSNSLDGIGSALGSELLKTGKFRVLERSQMSAILKEQGFQQSGACDGSECAVEMGKLLSVDQMVIGSVSKVGATYTLTARLVSVQNGEVSRSVTRNSRAEVDALLTEAVPATARELAGLPTADTSRAASVSPSHWGWWLAGGAVVAGGATAAVLLLSSSSSGSGTTGTTVNTDPGNQTPSTTHTTNITW